MLIMKIDNHFKDCYPRDTLHKIRSILTDCRIPTDIQWTEENGYGSSSLRVTIRGTDIGQNGKGMTRDYALASGMAEFMERLQNNSLFPHHFSDKTNSAYGFDFYPDEERCPLEIFVEQKSPWTTSLMKRFGMEDKPTEEKVRWMKDIGCTDKVLLGEDGLICVPFYSINQKRTFAIPLKQILNQHSTNGMCAGNSIHEAFVQGLSEIFERKVQRTILTRPVSLPDIPKSYLREHPSIYQMFTRLEEEDGYRFLLKDASSLETFPVVVFIAINLKKGTYGVRFGAHPQYSIAIERSMTEAFQGKGLNAFSQYSPLELGCKNTTLYTNLFNAYKVGMASYPPEILQQASNLKFSIPEDVPRDNVSMCDWAIKKVQERGLDILVRDVSYLGFPSLHLIIPGLSEMFTDKTIPFLNRLGNSKDFISKSLEKTGWLTPKNACDLKNLLDVTRNSLMENRLSNIYQLPIAPGFFPFESDGMGNRFLSAMCCGVCKEWDNGLELLKQMKILYENRGKAVPIGLSVCLCWFSGKSAGRSVMDIVSYLNVVYDEGIIGIWVKELMKLEDAIIPFMPQTNCFDCDDCKATCQCHYQSIEKIWLRLKSKMKNCFPDQKDLSGLFGIYYEQAHTFHRSDHEEPVKNKISWGEFFQPAEFLEASRMRLLPKEYRSVVCSFIGFQKKNLVLEVGCGSGAFTSYLDNSTEGLQICGLDSDAILIGEAKKKKFLRNRVSFIKGNAYALPFDNDIFDIVVSHTFFQCIYDKEKALDEMMRVTKKGGCIAAIVPMSLMIQAYHPGNYPDKETWVMPLKRMEEEIDAFIKVQAGQSLLNEENTTANIMPELFSKAGLSDIRILPLGKAFSLSNAAMDITDKQHYIKYWYSGEVKRFNTIRRYPAFRVEFKKDEDSYLQLLCKKKEFWLSHLEDNGIFEWEGNAALLICGNKGRN